MKRLPSIINSRCLDRSHFCISKDALTKGHALASIDEYIYFYNKRLHSSLYYMTPRQFEMSHILSE
ncbi:IS3 family transposase [Chryseomicrobium palamuruense]|uniref:IS3 family transposase n=1 Tax=Chryseomicrobium palamuruense TaxID=682973 RepID=A0ABV8UZ66_9BACL